MKRAFFVLIAELAIPVGMFVIAGHQIIHELGAVWYAVFLVSGFVWFTRFGRILNDASDMPVYRAVASASLGIAKRALGAVEAKNQLEKELSDATGDTVTISKD